MSDGAFVDDLLEFVLMSLIVSIFATVDLIGGTRYLADIRESDNIIKAWLK